MSPEELIERFSFFDDWQERYRYLIDLGMKLSLMEDSDKVEDNLVRGCMSRVWMVHQVDGAQIRFLADSDSHIVKGLIAILLGLYSERTPSQILALDIERVFKSIGLDQHLSPNRRNGFYSMVGRIRTVAEEGLRSQ
jgi:cysteine desulfuration protein SufE